MTFVEKPLLGQSREIVIAGFPAVVGHGWGWLVVAQLPYSIAEEFGGERAGQ